jgi:hypothetical protein
MLTQAERRQLADLCGLIARTTNGVKEYAKPSSRKSCSVHGWRPDDEESPAWQLQTVLESIPEDKISEFDEALVVELTGERHPTETLSVYEIRSATPEQVCRSVLNAIKDSRNSTEAGG